MDKFIKLHSYNEQVFFSYHEQVFSSQHKNIYKWITQILNERRPAWKGTFCEFALCDFTVPFVHGHVSQLGSQSPFVFQGRMALLERGRDFLPAGGRSPRAR